MRINAEGQVTVPVELRVRYGLEPGAEVSMEARGDGILLRRAIPLSRGQAIVAHLTGRATRRISTDAVMRLTRGE